ncbi:MAG: dephospho-CoA kinase [Oscillospiraceae bacterium]|nr:dephospho-CoA kinase [Oscillospiraceae bacterium]
MFLIGITGGTGSGKTTALRVLKSLGALALDCDAIYHGLLSSDAAMKSELEARFAGVERNGSIDRAVLAKKVFNDASALNDLNAITHKYVSMEIERQIENCGLTGTQVVAIDAIALIESGIAGICDVIVGTVAPINVRISRIMRRDGLTYPLAQMRINAQKPESYYREHCDFVLESNGKSYVEFEEKCKHFFAKLLSENGVNTSRLVNI